ncbi:MAG: integration host factor, actinobacterial type [Thermoleophilia bacterium]
MSPSEPTSATPVRTLEQRLDALRRANNVRSQRARLKKDLKKGAIKIDEILAAPPEFIKTAKVIDVLLAVPNCGKVKSAKVLNHCRISPNKTVGGLSERQRRELVTFFRP